MRFLVILSIFGSLLSCQNSDSKEKRTKPILREDLEPADTPLKREAEASPEVQLDPNPVPKPNINGKKQKDKPAEQVQNPSDEAEAPKKTPRALTGSISIDTSKPCQTDWNTIQDPLSVACHGSVEAIFESLPNWTRPYWVMMRSSESAGFTSLQSPRVILNAPDGKFFISVLTEEDSKEKIELAVYDENQEQWRFAGLDFATKDPTYDQASCLACHGQIPHPIWTGYNSWPGTIGDRDNLLADEAQFLDSVDKNIFPYNQLVFQNNHRGTVGGTLRPATGYAENTNNQILNFSIAKKRAHGVTNTLFKTQPETTDVTPLLYATACLKNRNTIINELSQLKIDHKNFYTFHKEQNSGGSMWIGFAISEVMMSIPLFLKLFETDQNFKSQLPKMVDILQDPRASIATLESTSETVQHMQSTNTGWYDFDFNWWSAIYLAELDNNSETCQRLQSLMQ
ncbi:MAG: hypothetical protein AB8C84_11495 [Oligoflexales bacterium]